MKILFLLPLLFFGQMTLAANIDNSCRVSLDVKDKSFELDNQTLSCVLVEQSRAMSYDKVISFSNDTHQSLDTAVKSLKNFRLKLKTAEQNGNWDFIESALVGNFIASAGLISCGGTMGVGCSLAIVGFIYAKYGTIRDAVNLNKQKAASKALREKILQLEASVVNLQQQKTLKDTTINSFNEMCRLVKANCL